MSTIWEDVKGRKIFKAATLYAAVAWGIIQIADVLLPVLRYPDWVMSSMVLIAFSGFPVALIAGWMLDIKHERLKLAEAADSEQLIIPISSRLIELAIIAVFGACATFLYLNSSNQPANANIGSMPSIHQLTEAKKNQKTIAVLPFASFGNSEDDDYFADGLSEELLNVLARNNNLRVAARTSSFQYKNKNMNIRKIAQELGVQYILEGSVRRSEDQIRVTAQLIKADEDVHIFSSTWDRNISNIFEVQDEIAQSVLETLEIKLLGKSGIQSKEIGTQDIAAFAEYSRGVAYIRNRSKDDFEKAIIHLNKALVIDSQYAEAYAMLAETYLLQFSYNLIDPDKAFELAKPNIKKALKINRDLAEGHAVMGLMHWQISNGEMDDIEQRDELLVKAKFHLNKAIELNPSNAEAYMWYGSILQNEGSLAEGTMLYKKAFEIDPQAAVVGFNLASDFVRTGHYDEAMAVFNTIVRNNPNYANAYQIAGNVSFEVGQLDQAYKMYKKIAELKGSETDWLLSENRILVPIGRYDLAQRNIDKIAQDENSKYIEGLPVIQAQVWIASGNLSKFYQWVDTLDEDSQKWMDWFWKGLAASTKQKWKYAANDLEKSLSLMEGNKIKRQDQMSIRIQLLLARAWQGAGNQIRSESYLNAALSAIDLLIEQKIVHSHALRYYQAAHAAISNQSLLSLGLLRQAIQEGFVDIWMIKVDPAFDSIRQDPTYLAILREFDAKIRTMRNNIKFDDERVAVAE